MQCRRKKSASVEEYCHFSVTANITTHFFSGFRHTWQSLTTHRMLGLERDINTAPCWGKRHPSTFLGAHSCQMTRKGHSPMT